ncbi:MAG: preprotein translocase subunit YajC [candidate division WOR-3 bacterium]|nr:preprotein translocase subunit YajC [candidate division WOR-3 bacterium]MCX7757880.1 preprotein translocase subunit YajC [candidate division WOR-3 bacterium]MDW7987676.1 preprotein translocase subunit YajC [candidate division WOR-3 bacterium]
MIGVLYGQSQQTGAGNPILSLLPIILIIVVFYFLLILPQQRRQKKHLQMINELKKGERVVLTSGIYGTITNVKEKTFIVKISENTEIEVEKTAVAYKL